MTEKENQFSNIWNISEDIVNKNNAVKKTVHSDIPDEDNVASDVNGYVINEVGNIVAQFGFFIENDSEQENIDLKISADGFLAKIYNEPTNIILGYGHPTGFTGLVDPKLTQILHLGPGAANGEDIIVSIPHDDMLKEKGLNFIIRDVDVVLDLLSDDVREDFEQSLEDAAEPVPDMNEIEESYNSYMRHMYVILGEETGDKPNEEEIYE